MHGSDWRRFRCELTRIIWYLIHEPRPLMEGAKNPCRFFCPHLLGHTVRFAGTGSAHHGCARDRASWQCTTYWHHQGGTRLAKREEVLAEEDTQVPRADGGNDESPREHTKRSPAPRRIWSLLEVARWSLLFSFLHQEAWTEDEVSSSCVCWRQGQRCERQH